MAALLFAAMLMSATPADTPRAQGKAIAEAHCQTCHAIGRRGASPREGAPVFRALSRRYPVENLAEAFAEGVFVGHPVMPEFRMSPEQIDALIAYLQSVQRPKRRLRGQ